MYYTSEALNEIKLLSKLNKNCRGIYLAASVEYSCIMNSIIEFFLYKRFKLNQNIEYLIKIFVNTE